MYTTSEIWEELLNLMKQMYSNYYLYILSDICSQHYVYFSFVNKARKDHYHLGFVQLKIINEKFLVCYHVLLQEEKIVLYLISQQ